jgi:hypothetical protein
MAINESIFQSRLFSVEIICIQIASKPRRLAECALAPDFTDRRTYAMISKTTSKTPNF